MKHTLSIALVAWVSLATQAWADGMPAAAPKLAVSSYVAETNWSGAYIGGHLGWGWSQNQWSDADDHSDDVSYHGDGFLGGGQVGYNYQLGPWVIGIQGDFSGTDIEGSGVPINEAEPTTLKTKVDWTATLTGRLGYAQHHALYYVKGGAAWAHNKQTLTEIDDTETLSAQHTDTRTGWTVGAGAEFALHDNWSVGAEYDFLDFGSNSIAITPLMDEPSDFDQHINEVKLTLNYRFGADRARAPIPLK